MNIPRFTPLLMLAALVGCRSSASEGPAPATSEMWVSRWINEATQNEAILREKTVYPYHFVPETAELNDLGLRTVSVLAGHFVQHDGSMNVRQGDASEALQDARLAAVRAHLSERRCALPGGLRQHVGGQEIFAPKRFREEAQRLIPGQSTAAQSNDCGASKQDYQGRFSGSTALWLWRRGRPTQQSVQRCRCD